MQNMTIRPAKAQDFNAIYTILEPIFAAGETYAMPSDMPRETALRFWCGDLHTAYVAEFDKTIIGTYYIGPNQQGGGDHICNCGFATSPAARGKGIARKMLAHALTTARAKPYAAMQFNFVVANNLGALKIWRDNGFLEIGRLPKAFNHPNDGFVDALVLFKTL